MQAYLNIVQILISISLIVVVLLQVRSMGSGMFGGGQSTGHTRRGLELTLFRFTIVLVVLFIAISILSVRLS